MVRKTSNRKRTQPPPVRTTTRTKRTRRRNPQTNRRGMLDTAALAHARLLADPCNAPLCQPIYPGGDSGFLFRADNFFSMNGGALETAGMIHWTPGYVNASSTELLIATSSSSSTNATSVVKADGTPGKNFLNSNTKAVRCVGACLKVTYAGAESGRSGRIHYGHTSSGMIDAGNVVTIDNVCQALQHYGRTPAEAVELRWFPGIGDFEFNDPTEPGGALNRDRKTSITFAYVGLPAAVPITFHLTAIYEWRPAIGLGVSSNTLGKANSRNTIDDVLDFLISSGEKFVSHAGMAAGNSMMSQVSSMFGLMPSRASSRSNQSMYLR